jgi:hypothetical protein
MIDWVKCYTYDKSLAASLRMHVCSNVDVNHTSGEINRGEYSGELGGVRIRVFESGRVEFAFSLHKYFHSGYNFKDFMFYECNQAIFSFCSAYNLDPRKVFLSNLEFGVNLRLNKSVVGLLDAIVGLSCGATFNSAPKRGKYCLRRDYRFKIYNKSAQVKFAPDNVLRFELHVDKMRKVQPVKTLHDLRIEANWELLSELLVSHFSQIIFADLYVLNNAPESVQRFYREYSREITNSRFWRNLERTKRFRCLKAFRELQPYSVNNWANQTKQLIIEKTEQLRKPQRMYSSDIG